MKKLLFVLILALSSSNALRAADADDTGSVKISAAFWSRYIWRGYDLNGRKPVLQPSVEFLSLPYGFAAELDGSIGLDRNQLDEADISLSYALDIFDSTLSATAAIWSYQYLGTPATIYLTGDTGQASSEELLFTFTTNKIPWGYVTLEYGRGLGGVDGGNGIKGNYVSLSIGKDFDLTSSKLSSVLSAVYLDQYQVPNKIVALSLANSMTWNFERVGVSPNLNFTYLPDPEIMNGNEEKTIVCGGVSIIYRI